MNLGRMPLTNIIGIIKPGSNSHDPIVLPTRNADYEIYIVVECV